MNAHERSETLRRLLFENGDDRLYAVLDGAAIPNLRPLLAQYEVSNVCLLRGALDPELAQTAPYLAELPPESPFTELLSTQGWGNHWGILAHSGDDMRTLRMHFRKFLTVRNTDGKPLHFRYYDPRVLRHYLPTCDAEDLRVLFGPVTAYLAEADTADELVRLTFTGKALGQQRITLSRNESAPTEA